MENTETLHPEGKFLGRIKQWTLAETKAGAPQVYLLCQLDDGELLPYYGNLGERSFDITMKALRAGGYTGTDLVNDLERADAGLDRNPVQFVLEHEEYEGKKRCRVKWINPVGGNVAPLDPAKKASFRDSLRAKALAFDKAQPKATPTGPGKQVDGPPAGHPADADVPPPF